MEVGVSISLLGQQSVRCNELFHDPIPGPSNKCKSEIYFLGSHHRAPAWGCSNTVCCFVQSHAYNFTDYQEVDAISAVP